MNKKFFIRKNQKLGIWEVCYQGRGQRNAEVLAACAALEDAKFFYMEFCAIVKETGMNGLRYWLQQNEEAY